MVINAEDLFEIVIKIIGPCQPVGDHGVDEERKQNLRKLLSLTENLLWFIEDISRQRTREDQSIREVGQLANDFIIDITDGLS